MGWSRLVMNARNEDQVEFSLMKKVQFTGYLRSNHTALPHTQGAYRAKLINKGPVAKLGTNTSSTVASAAMPHSTAPNQASQRG